MVATIVTCATSNQIADCALDFWCYMQDEEDTQRGRKEFLCLAGNLWVIPPSLSRTESDESSYKVVQIEQQDPIQISALKDALRFDAFSKQPIL